MFSPDDFIIRRECTPFCEIPCNYAGEHHPLLIAILNCTDSRGYKNFTKTISKHMRRSWRKDDPIKDVIPEFRYPLVHWATVLGNVMVLKWCIEHGVDLNKRCGPRSETALHRFMVCGYSALKETTADELKTFKKLLKLLKVLLKSKDDNKDLPIHVGAKVLMERPLKNDSSFEQIYCEMLKILVRKTCELDAELLNCRNVDGNTIAHIIAQHDKGCGVLELLLENGADCDLPNSEGLRPIDMAKAEDATEIIRLLSRDEDVIQSDDLSVEEIGDVDVIYIESDVDSIDRNNNEATQNEDNDDAYIQNLLERIKSEPDDDPDWGVDGSNTDLDAPTSNDTLYTLDEDSYDIGDDALNPLEWTAFGSDLPFEESENLRSSSVLRKDIEKKLSSTEKASNLKRKSSDNSEHISKKRPSDGENESKISSTKSIEAFLASELEIDGQMELTSNSNPSTILNSESDKANSSKIKRKLSENGTVSGLEAKKQKAVSPKLEIELNMSRFKSLKKKVSGKMSKNVFGKSLRQVLTESSVHSDSDGEVVDLPTNDSVCETSNQRNKSEANTKESKPSSPIVEVALPGMCTWSTQGQLPDCLSLSPSEELATAETNFTTTKPAEKHDQISDGLSPDLATEIPSTEIPQCKTSSTIVGEENVPQTAHSSQRSFSSSAEILSAYKRLRDKMSNGPTNVNLSKLHELVDILKPAETATEQPVGRSTPSPVPLEQQRHRRRIEDVVSNLRERQQAGIMETATRQESVSESTIAMSGDLLNPRGEIESSSSTSQSDSIDEQGACTSASLQQDLELNARVHTVKNDAASGQESNTTQEHIEAVGDIGPESSSSTPVANDDAASSQEDEQPTLQLPHNVVIKKEVKDNECGGNTLDINLGTGETQSTSYPSCSESNSRNQNIAQIFTSRVKQEKDDSTCSGIFGENSAPQSEGMSNASVRETNQTTVGDVEDGYSTYSVSSISTNDTTTNSSGGKIDGNGEHIESSSSFQPRAGNSEINQTTADKEHDSGIVTKRSNKRPRFPRLALPTQVQAGSYRPMLPAGVQTSTATFDKPADIGSTTSTVSGSKLTDNHSTSPANNCSSTPPDTSDNATVDGGDRYHQQLSSAVDKFCEEVYGASPSKNTPAHSRDPNYDSLSSMIDKICEEIYSVSPGLQKQIRVEKQGDTTTQEKESVEGSVTREKAALDSVTRSQTVLPSHSEAVVPSQVQMEGTVPSQNNVQEPVQASLQSTATQGQTVAATSSQQSVQLSVSASPQTHGSIQSPMQASVQGPHVHRYKLIREQLLQTLPNKQTAVQAQQVPVQSQPLLQTQGLPQIQRPGQVAAHAQQLVAQGYVTRPRLPVQQQQQQQGQALRQHIIIQTPAQGQGTMSLHVPTQLSRLLQKRTQTNLQAVRSQGPRPAQPVLQQIQHLSYAGLQRPTTISQTNSHPQIINQFSMNRQLNSQNPSIGRSQQNVTRPTPMMRPQIRIGNVVNYAVIPSAEKIAQLIGGNTATTQPTLAQLTSIYNSRSMIPSGRTNVSGQPIQSLAQVRTTNPRLNTSHLNVPRQQAQTTTSHAQSRGPDIATQAPILIPNDGRPITVHVVGPDTATAIANKIGKDPSIRGEASSEPGNRETHETDIPGSRGSTPSTSPSRTPGVNQSRALQVDDTSTNPEESEDEGLGLNGFSEADNVKDIFKDMSDISGTKKSIEKLTKLVPKEDIVQLLEKTKNDTKEKIDKWTNEYEAAARCERRKYEEFETWRENIERAQETVRKMCTKISDMKEQAETCRREKLEAFTKKTEFQNKIAEENDKIPMINELIDTFKNEIEDAHSEK